MKNRFTLFFVLVLGLFMRVYAQEFTHQYLIESPAKAGWYWIKLNPDLRSNAKEDLSDLRVKKVSDTSAAIPYGLGEFKANDLRKNEVYFTSYEWKKNRKPFSAQYFIETKGKTISKLVFKVSNHQDHRNFSLQGSNDGEAWFSIVDGGVFDAEPSDAGSYYWKTISFPKVDYQQLKFSFLDSINKEIQVLDIGNISQLLPNEPEEVQVNQIQFQVFQLTAEKKSIVKVFSEKPNWIHHLSFRIKEPVFYDRMAEVYEKKMIKRRRGGVIEERNTLRTLQLKAGTKNSFSFPYYLKDTLYISIDNLDNPPLKFEDISFFQEPIYISCYLEKGQEVSLFVGNVSLQHPQYDISSFSNHNNVTSKDNILEIIGSKKLKVNSVQTENPASFWKRKGFMWACMLVGVLALALFSFKLMKEKETTH